MLRSKKRSSADTGGALGLTDRADATSSTGTISTMRSETSPLAEGFSLDNCLAKTRTDVSGISSPGRTVLEHCQIAGAVADCLLRGLLPIQQALLPAHAAVYALLHDVGKVCPTFQKKIHQAAGTPYYDLPELAKYDPKSESTWGGHGAVTLATLRCWNKCELFAKTAAEHHGRTLQKKPYFYAPFGGEYWHELRRKLIVLLMEIPIDNTTVWPTIHTEAQARLLAGLTAVADWIASGSLFDNPAQPWKPLVEEAVARAGFTPLHIRRGLPFEAIFPFSPTEVQQQFANAVKGPGVYVLEAPMGMGKTEAALFAAYGLLEKGLSSGIYFALPTQLTSSRIYARLRDFLTNILDEHCEQRAHLLHGKAWLAPYLLHEMGEDAAANGSWFSGKRGILAPFAAGTVDQALMAVIRVRHGAVRAFGLAGKTVILDEVHSYDGYTGALLESLVRLLREYNCTVIILSATLTAKHRGHFVKENLQENESTQTAYPLISCSATDNKESPASIPCASPTAHTTSLTHCVDDAEAFEEALHRAEEGQQVLWIENTVREAQARFRLVASRTAEMNVEAGLVHSRFTPADRATNEEHWTTLYGKHASQRASKGRVLVGTQVLEQSLDIDADFLVTRFCPTDMLLQRLGRLWRHEATVRPASARREAWLLRPSTEAVLADPQKSWGSTGNVYAPYVLCRSLDVWAPCQSVILPDSIRTLLEATYADRDEVHTPLAPLLDKVKLERAKLAGLAYSALATGSVTQSDDTATTRAGQRPTADVLLLRGVDTATGHVTLASGDTLLLQDAASKNWKERQEIAAMLTMNMVRVPENNAPPAVAWKSLRWLHPWVDCGYDRQNTSQDNKALLRVAIIDKDDTLHGLARATISDSLVLYRHDYGYMIP